MKQFNENEKNDCNTIAERCPGCGRHCPADALSCGRGQAIMAGERGYKDHDHRRHEHRGSGGFEPDEHSFRRDHGVPFEKDNSLYGLMRKCGHHLYHRKGGPGQRRVLKILQERGSMPQRELQDYLGIQPGSMSELIGKLEQKGLLRRAACEKDRRSRILMLTEQGREMTDAVKEEQELFGMLSEEEQEQLRALLIKLLEAWDEKTDRSRDTPGYP